MVDFKEIPNGYKVPGVYQEVDNSLANIGLTGKESVGLIIGQKLSTGTGEFNTCYLAENINRVAELAGVGSDVHRMAEKFEKNNKYNAFKVIFVEQTEGVAATYTIEATATDVQNGSADLLLAGTLIQSVVYKGQTASEILEALVDAINEETMIPVTAALVEGKIVLTAKHKGLAGNNVDIQFNYYNNQKTPKGLTFTVAQTVEGVGNASIADVLAALTPEYFTDGVTSYTDEPNLLKLRSFLNDRFGAMVQNEGNFHICINGTHSELLTLAATLNCPHINLIENYKTPNMPEERAARVAGIVAFKSQQDPARQYRTAVLVGDLPSKTPFDDKERNLLLKGGVSTVVTNASGNVAIERVVTTYRKNTLGVYDESYFDLTIIKTIIYLRWSYVNWFLTKYPDYKLAKNGHPIGVGQAIVTPDVIESEAISWANMMLKAGLIEDIEGFVEAIHTEINASDPDRVDQIIRPDIINNFMILASKMQFKR
ncbi:MAG: phage tail sheath subtilisin-like domain-containing protein [Alphaproteobacteria bacterium]